MMRSVTAVPHEDKLQRLKDNNCDGLTTNMQKGDVIYIPGGWLVAESVPEDSGLVYGARSTCLAKTSSNHQSVEALMDLQVASGKKVDKMRLAVDALDDAD